MSDSITKYFEMQEDRNCRVGKTYPVISAINGVKTSSEDESSSE